MLTFPVFHAEGVYTQRARKDTHAGGNKFRKRTGRGESVLVTPSAQVSAYFIGLLSIFPFNRGDLAKVTRYGVTG